MAFIKIRTLNFYNRPLHVTVYRGPVGDKKMSVKSVIVYTKHK